MKRTRFAVLYLAAGLSAVAAGTSGCAACPGVKVAEPPRPPVIVKEQPAQVQAPPRAPTGPATIELTPLTDVNPVQTQHTFVATVRDSSGNPVPGAKVEWMLANGTNLCGDIVDVEGGKKIDNSYAISATGSGNRVLDRGTPDTSDDIPLGPGQTWCTITSTVEGTSKMIAYAPDIRNWDNHKAFAEKNWMDVTWEWPADATNRVGTPHTFNVKVMRYSDGAPYQGYVVNYRLLSGPAGKLSTGTTTTNAQGVASVVLTQDAPAKGTNEVEITLVRPARKDDCVCQPEKLLGTWVARKTWVAPDVAIDKNAPATAGVGETFVYDIAVRNTANDVDLRGVTVSDTLPEGIEYVSSAPAASVSGQSLTWNLGSLPAAGVQNLQITVRAKREGRFENCATVTAENGALTAKDCAETVVTAPKLQIRKTATPVVTLCDPIRYTITVTNPGSGTASDVRVVDNLPAGITSMDGLSTVTFGPMNLGPGQTQEFSFDAKASQGGSFTNTATVTAAGGLTDTATAVTQVKTCKLAITKVAKRGDLVIGRPATFDITVSNQGDADAPNTVLEDQIPAGLSFQSATDGGQNMGSTVSWNLGTLTPGASKTVSVTMTGSMAGSFTNTATARATCCDSVSASAPVSFKGVAAILLELVDSPDPIEVGGQTTYTIDVTNQGNADDNNIVIRCTLPSQQKFVAADSSGAGNVTHTVDGQNVRFAPFPALAPKARITYKVTVSAAAVGDVRFAVELTSDMLQSPVNETESTHIY